jgi:hypothetical protein
MVRHGLAIFAALGVDQIASIQFNRELKRLDLPDAKWTRYRGASNLDYPHPLQMHEQAWLLHKAGIESKHFRDLNREQHRGYKRAQFEEAARRQSKSDRERLRLVTP